MPTLLRVFLILTLLLGSFSVRAQESMPSASDGGGKLLFFPERADRPEEDRFEVKAGDVVPYCIQVDLEASPVLKRIREEAVQVRLVLENQQDPPDLLLIELGNAEDPIKPGENGCYEGSFRIPKQARGGRYQVADFLVKTRRANFVSLRQLLFQFSAADELQVENPNFDDSAPRLLAIETLEKGVQKLDNSGDFIRLLIHQTFRFNDEKGEVDTKTLRVYYALLEDGQQVSIHQANCKKEARTHTDFVCAVKLLRPYWHWELRSLQLVLESIYVQDKAGNGLVIQSSEDLKKIAGNTPIRFEFKPDGPGISSKRLYQRHPSMN